MLYRKRGDAFFRGKTTYFCFGLGFLSYIFFFWMEAKCCVCKCEVFVCFQCKKLRKAWKIKRKEGTCK